MHFTELSFRFNRSQKICIMMNCVESFFKVIDALLFDRIMLWDSYVASLLCYDRLVNWGNYGSLLLERWLLLLGWWRLIQKWLILLFFFVTFNLFWCLWSWRLIMVEKSGIYQIDNHNSDIAIESKNFNLSPLLDITHIFWDAYCTFVVKHRIVKCWCLIKLVSQIFKSTLEPKDNKDIQWDSNEIKNQFNS